jgi:hypothetical protein
MHYTNFTGMTAGDLRKAMKEIDDNMMVFIRIPNKIDPEDDMWEVGGVSYTPPTGISQEELVIFTGKGLRY